MNRVSALAVSLCWLLATTARSGDAPPGMEAAGGEPESGQVADVETESFLLADADADLRLEYEEFRAFIGLLADADHRSAKWVRGLRLYAAAFSMIDTNEDGFVEPAELREGQSAHGK